MCRITRAYRELSSTPSGSSAARTARAPAQGADAPARVAERRSAPAEHVAHRGDDVAVIGAGPDGPTSAASASPAARTWPGAPGRADDDDRHGDAAQLGARHGPGAHRGEVGEEGAMVVLDVPGPRGAGPQTPLPHRGSRAALVQGQPELVAVCAQRLGRRGHEGVQRRIDEHRRAREGRMAQEEIEGHEGPEPIAAQDGGRRVQLARRRATASSHCSYTVVPS